MPDMRDAYRPALSLAEAAMLPAMMRPGGAVDGGGRPVDNSRRGSMCGLALLAHVKSAPARRRRRMRDHRAKSWVT